MKDTKHTLRYVKQRHDLGLYYRSEAGPFVEIFPEADLDQEKPAHNFVFKNSLTYAKRTIKRKLKQQTVETQRSKEANYTKLATCTCKVL